MGCRDNTATYIKNHKTMRRIILGLLVAAATIVATAEIRVVTLDKDSNLKEILGTDTMTLDSMKINGYLSHENLYTVAWMTFRKLAYIDMGDCDLENDEIPEEGLNPYPFLIDTDNMDYYTKLSSVIFPKKLKRIGDYALATSLVENIELPDELESIGVSAFDSCKRLKGKVTIPEGINTLAASCFYYCARIDTLSLPSTLKNIEENALSGLISMRSINLPNSIQSIGNGACSYWFGYLNDLALPESLETLGRRAFRQSHIQKLFFNEQCKLASISQYAFEDCRLTEVSFSPSIIVIEEGAFRNNFIEELYLPASIRSIDILAFQNCKYLKKVVIPATIREILGDAFNSCNSLTDIYIMAMNPPTIVASSFEYPERMTLYVPEGAKAAYEAANHWKDFGAIVEVTEFPSAGREAVIAEGAISGRAFGAAGEAVVEGDDVPYAIFSTDGTEVASGVAEGRTTIPLPAGIYVASVGGKARRIAVR